MNDRLTASKVAEILGVKVQTLSMWRARHRETGILRGPLYHKLGGRVVYRVDEVQKYLEEVGL